MQESTQTGKSLFMVMAAVLAVAAIVVVGCSAGSLSSTGTTGTTTNAATSSTPVSITDAPSDQVLAATLTLNSVVLKNSSNTSTANLLSSPLTFEATHLDAVQEPLFTPAIPQDTYTSVTVTYSTWAVAYVDPTTKQVVTATGTATNPTQTITFSSPITVGNAKTTLLIDYLVAQSVNISGSTVTVTPTFHVTAAPIQAQPTNGTNGLECGVKGKITALGTNQITITNPAGVSMTVTVNGNTQYQGSGLTAFSGLSVGMFVEVDLELQTDGTLLAMRVEQDEAPSATAALLVGPVTAVTGTPATTFKEIVRQRIDATTTAPVETDTITITGTTKFQLPGRLQNISLSGLPFTPTFDANSIFAGQVVAVATSGVTNNAATALGVMLSPQTIGGTVTLVAPATCVSCWAQYTVTLPSGSWLATLTGKSTVLVYSPPVMQMIAAAVPTASTAVRFNGFLFNNNGTLTMIAVVGGPGPGTPIDQH